MFNRSSSASSQEHHRSASLQSGIKPMDLSRMGGKAQGGGSGGGKVVGSLIGRLLIKLPHSTGRSSTEVESDPIVSQLISSLITISRNTLPLVLIGLLGALDPLVRQTAHLSSANMSSHVLESQAILLKVTYQCILSDWEKYANPDSTIPGPWTDPPELDDAISKSLLSLLLSLIRQITFQASSPTTSSSSESWPIPGTFVTKGAAASKTTSISRGKNASGTSVMRYLHCSDAVKDLGLGYRRPPGRKLSPMLIDQIEDTDDLVASTSHRHSVVSSPTTPNRRIPMIIAAAFLRIERYTGRLVFALSTYNWNVVRSRITSRVTYLTQAGEERPDTGDLRLLEWCHLDQGKLVSILQTLSSSFLHLKRSSQLAVSCLIRHIVLNWIDTHTSQYINLIASNRVLDRSVEMLCDFMFQTASDGKGFRTSQFFPAIAALLVVSPEMVERVSTEKGRSGSSLAKRIAFVEAIRRNPRDLTNLLCQTDILRAAAYLQSNSNSIQMLASEIASDRDFKEHLLQSAVLDEDLAIERLVGLVRALSVSQGVTLINQGLRADAGDRSKRVTIRACIVISQEANRASWTEFLCQLYPTAAPAVRSIAKSLAERISSGKALESLDLMHALCQLFRNDLQFVLYGCLHSPIKPDQDHQPYPQGIYDPTYDLHSDEDGLPQLISSLSALLVQPTPSGLRHEVAELLSFVLERGVGIGYGNPGDDAIKRSIAHSCTVPLLKASAQTIWSLKDINPYKYDLQILHAILGLVCKILDQFYTYAGDPQDCQAISFAASTAGIALLVSSSTNDLRTVATNMGFLVELSELRRRHLAMYPVEALGEPTMFLRWELYERLAIPHDIVGGPQVFQKFIRGVFRSHAAASPVLLAAWKLQSSRFFSLLGRVIGGTSTSPHGRYNVDGLTDSEAQELKNIGGMVAAMANVCGHPTPSNDHKRYAATLVEAGFPIFATEEDPINALHAFVNEECHLLVADSAFLRTAAEEALGVDLPDTYNAYLLETLSNLLGHSISADGSMEGSDSSDTLCWGVLCVLERRATLSNEGFEKTLSKLVQYCSIMTPSKGIRDRCRLKVLKLMQSRSDSMPEDVLNTLIDWTSTEDGGDALTGREADEKRKLDIACLQAYASGSSGMASRIDLQERSIGRHISWLIRMADRATTEDIIQCLVTACENLCHYRSGLLQFIKLAQTSDNHLRTIVVQSLASSLRHSVGTFTPRERGPRQYPFSEFIIAYSSVLLPVVASLSRQDEYIVGVLYRIFERQSKELTLLDTLVEAEVVATDDASSLFRSNSLCTRSISAFAQSQSVWIYFHNLLSSFFRDLASKSSEVILDLEEHELAAAQHSRTADFIQAVCLRMVDRLVQSTASAPRLLRLLVASVSKHAQTKFGTCTNAVSGIIFLRILCPAMAAPERFGLVVAPELSRAGRWCSKIFNVLASGQMFKENMKTFNSFLQANSDKMLTYLHQLPAEGEASYVLSKGDKHGAVEDAESDDIYCCQFVNQHLVEIAAAADRSQSNMMQSLTQAVGSSNIGDVHFSGNVEAELARALQRPSERSTSRANSAFFEGERCLNGRRLFYLIGSSLDSAYEDGLLTHMVQMLSGTNGEEYDVILDLFGTSAVNGPEPKAVARLLAIVTKSTAGTMGTLALFLPNFTTEVVIRRLLLSSGGQLLRRGSKIIVASSPSELLKVISYNSLQLPAATLAAATSPPRPGINDILYISPAQSHHIPCVVTFGQTLTIQSRTKQDLMSGVSSFLLEVHVWSSLDESFSDRFLGADKRKILDAINERRGKAAAIKKGGKDFTQTNEVAAALLCTSLQNLTNGSRALRQASYDLLIACEPYVTSEGPYVTRSTSHLPSNLTMITVGVMERCASVKHLTVPFINVWCEAFLTASEAQRPFFACCLRPWVKNLIAIQQDEDNYDSLSCWKSLIGLQSLGSVECLLLEQNVWQLVVDSKDETLSELATHLMIQRAIYIGTSSLEFDGLCGTLVLLTPADTFSRWAARLRKAIANTHTQLPVQSLRQHHAWAEISAQLRILLNLTHRQSSLADRCHIAFGLPDVLYSIIMLSGIGTEEDRVCLHALLVNVTMKLAEFAKAGPKKDALRELHDRVTGEHKLLGMFGLRANETSAATGHVDGNDERIDDLCVLLQKVLEAGAPSTDMANIWFSRLTGLLASTCFQSNSTTQGRAFSALALLIEGDVLGQEIEDDLLYQILVAMRSCLLSYSGQSGLLTSMLRCLTRAVPLLGQESRYAGGMAFWLGVAILQIGHQPLFLPACELLTVTLDTMDKQAMLSQGALSDVLLAFRQHEIQDKLDQVTGLSFETSFSFSMLGLLFKGARTAASRDLTIALLQRCLERELAEGSGVANDDALGYILALCAARAPLSRACTSAGITSSKADRNHIELHVGDYKAATLAVPSILGLLDVCESDADRVWLYGCLLKIASTNAEVVSMWQAAITPRAIGILNSTENAELLELVTSLITNMPTQGVNGSINSDSDISLANQASMSSVPSGVVTALQDMGMDGLLELGFGEQNMERIGKKAEWAARLFSI